MHRLVTYKEPTLSSMIKDTDGEVKLKSDLATRNSRNYHKASKTIIKNGDVVDEPIIAFE